MKVAKRIENGTARRTRFGAQGAIYPGEEDKYPEGWVEGFDGLETVKAVVVTQWGLEPDTIEQWRGSADGFGEPFRTGSSALRRALVDTLLGDITYA